MLHVHAADRLAPLAAGLARVLSDPPADPLTPEWVAVPAEGMRRWLALELARHLGAGPLGGDGIAANVTWAFPGALRSAVLTAARSHAGHPDPDPWQVEQLVWPVFELLAAAEDDPELGRFVTDDPAAPVSTYGRARRLADLYDRYHVHRPAMIRHWAAGRDLDGADRPLLPGQRWQAHLWRRVRAAVGVPSPAELLPGALDRVARGDLTIQDLPPRLILFGLSVLPGGAAFAPVAAALAPHRELHLFLLDPSLPTSERVRAQILGPSAAPRPLGLRSRPLDRSAEAVHHPLLRSWARPSRETAILLADAEADGLPRPQPVPVAPEPPAATLLAALQADLRAGCAPRKDHVTAADDRSVQLHAAHGPARQVEVLRDAVLHLLAADPTLQEDDVVVVCPALERFAPLLETGLGTPEAATRSPDHTRAPALRHRVADRSLRHANPVVEAASAAVDLAASRFEGPAVLDLAARPAVRERFGFSEADLTRMSSWVADAHVRWGLDPDHRAAYGLPPTITTNTWQAALDRLLLGAAVAPADDQPFTVGGVVPLGIEGDDVDLAGRLAELLHHLTELAHGVDQPRPLAAWLDLLERTAFAIVAAPRGEERQRERLDRAVADLRTQAGERGEATHLRLTFADLRRVLTDHLAGAPGRPDYFRGGVTITSTDGLRWVPHRVVCLLGMDQQAFATSTADGDDLAAAAPAVGDREARAEGRQAILESVLATQDHLIVIRDGHDVRTNQEIPRSVVVAELCDALAATAAPASERSAGPPAEVHHPRQAFDERNLQPGALGPVASGTPWTFDPSARTGASARRARPPHPAPFLAEPLPSAPSAVVELADLHAVLASPAKVFLEQRLQVRLPREEDALLSRLPVTVQGLDEWKVADRLLRAHLDGADVADRLRVEEATGALPPGVLGQAKAEAITDWIGRLRSTAEELGVRPGPAEPTSVDVVLPDGTRVVGTIDLRLGEGAPGPARISYSRQKPTHLLAAWLDLLVLAAAEPGVVWRSVAVNRQPNQGKKVVVEELFVAGGHEDERRARATDGLALVVDLLARARTEPLPLFPRLSQALLLDQATRAMWTRAGDDRPPGDRDERNAEVAWGDLSLDELLALPAQPHDPPGAAPGRVARYAAHLWDAYARTTGPGPAAADRGPR